jgi:hypothetical protein
VCAAACEARGRGLGGEPFEPMTKTKDWEMVGIR